MVVAVARTVTALRVKTWYDFFQVNKSLSLALSIVSGFVTLAQNPRSRATGMAYFSSKTHWPFIEGFLSQTGSTGPPDLDL
jgi:hypothetical protein